VRLLHLREQRLHLDLLKHPLATEGAEAGDPRLFHFPVGVQHNAPSEGEGVVAGGCDEPIHNARRGAHQRAEASAVLAPESREHGLEAAAAEVPWEYPDGQLWPV